MSKSKRASARSASAAADFRLPAPSARQPEARSREPAAPHRPLTRWLALVAGLLAVLAGALLLHSRKPPGDLALPDPPAAPERALLARMAAARPDDPTPARLLGDYYLDGARPFAALWAYAAALQAQPGDIPAALGLARALEQARFRDEAIARLQRLVDGRDEVAAQLGELYLQTGRPQAALRAVRAAGAAFAKSRDGAVLEGRVRQALGDAPGAKAAYERALARDADDAEVQRRIGLLALAQGEVAAAQQALSAARTLAPADPRAAVDLGRAFAAGVRPEEQRRAAELYAAALGRDPRCGPAHSEAGLWYLRQSRWPEAIQQLQIAVALDPGDADARERLAQALEGAGRAAEAHRQRGLADQTRNLRVAALREFQAWAALEPDSPEAALQVAQATYDISRAGEARTLLEKARRRFPHDAALRERLITFDILGHDTAPARRLCREWLQEEPGAPPRLWLLGRVAEAEQQDAEAARLYEQALAGEPDHPQWLGTLGETLLQMPGTPTLPRAVATLARAAAAAPDEPRWRFFLAQGLQRLGRIDDARRQALRALDLDPHEIPAYNLVLQCARQEREAGAGPGLRALYAGLMRSVEAKQREASPLWHATWEHPGDPQAFAALADFLLRTGNPAAAEPQLAEALRLRPNWPAARARLATLRRLQAVQ